MRNTAKNTTLIARFVIAAGIGLIVIPGLSAIAATAIKQKIFATPAAAVEALIAANRADKLRELLAILGTDGAKLIHSGDPVADKRGRARFLAAYDEAHTLQLDAKDKAILIVGKEEWPLPIPLVRRQAGWLFDTKAGMQEILNRRIGRNELSVIEVCRAYVVAQREYASKHTRPGSAHEYAKHFMSTDGQRNGLYWPIKPGEEESPLGPLVARARAAGYSPGTSHSKPQPYYGYFFKILTQQGENAPGGAMNYIISNGRLTGGFGLIAYPATYGDAGIMTFIVNQDGIVYQKNLGSKTARIAQRITRYDPDSSWQVSQP